MIGIPKVLSTKQDWLNTFQYLVESPTVADKKKQFVAQLNALKSSNMMLVLKAGVNKEPEDQTPEDFEPKLDPNSPLVRSGLTISDIDAMIAQLS